MLSPDMLLRNIKRPRRPNNPRLARLTPILLTITLLAIIQIILLISTRNNRLRNRQRDIIQLKPRTTTTTRQPRREKVSRPRDLARRVRVPRDRHPVKSHPRGLQTSQDGHELRCAGGDVAETEG